MNRFIVFQFFLIVSLLCFVTSSCVSKNDAEFPEIPEMFGEPYPMTEDDKKAIGSDDNFAFSADYSDEPISFSLKTNELLSSIIDGSIPTPAFSEIWGYVLSGLENTLPDDSVLTDVGYFGAGINVYGELSGVPSRKKLSNYQGRVHLVVADGGSSFSHMVLSPELPMRNKFIDDLIIAAQNFDGVQIDFETIPSRDKENYITFLSDVKSKLGNKVLSVALPARIQFIANDTFDYNIISQIADRIIVMAYDEHWSTSKPGPVASLEWCTKIASYAKTKISEEKLVVGLPLYGRAWTDDDSPGAYRMSTIEKMINENNWTSVMRKDGNTSMIYNVNSTISLYFDDFQSLYDKLSMYENAGITKTAFWRLGLEYQDFWQLLRIKD